MALAMATMCELSVHQKLAEKWSLYSLCVALLLPWVTWSWVVCCSSRRMSIKITWLLKLFRGAGLAICRLLLYTALISTQSFLLFGFSFILLGVPVLWPCFVSDFCQWEWSPSCTPTLVHDLFQHRYSLTDVLSFESKSDNTDRHLQQKDPRWDLRQSKMTWRGMHHHWSFAVFICLLEGFSSRMCKTEVQLRCMISLLFPSTLAPLAVAKS